MAQVDNTKYDTTICYTMKGKVPCEVITWYVLPVIRRELATKLVKEHDITQKKTAELLGLTDAAISQYVSRKRGKIDLGGRGDSEFEKSVQRILDGKPVNDEICRLCKYLMSRGILEEIEDGI